MNPLTHLTGLVQKLFKPQGVKRLNPSRDWIIILSCALVGMVVIMLWNMWFFFAVLNQEAVLPATTQTKNVDTSSIEKVRTTFEVRALEEARYRSEYRFIDPSL